MVDSRIDENFDKNLQYDLYQYSWNLQPNNETYNITLTNEPTSKYMYLLEWEIILQHLVSNSVRP